MNEAREAYAKLDEILALANRRDDEPGNPTMPEEDGNVETVSDSQAWPRAAYSTSTEYRTNYQVAIWPHY